MAQAYRAHVILNCDCGEGVGDDAAVLPHVTAANIACGGHAGDEASMRAALALCRVLGVSAGAHPGYPDRAGFGRRAVTMSQAELAASLRAQIQTLQRLADEASVVLTHIKPHGALYNQAARDEGLAELIAGVVAEFNRGWALIAPTGSALARTGQAAGLRVLREGFADRAYERDGTLRPRDLPGALITDLARCTAQALAIALDGEVTAHDGTRLALAADTICVHSDTSGAAERAAHLRRALAQAGVLCIGMR
jgi:UPF0271 protein